MNAAQYLATTEAELECAERTARHLAKVADQAGDHFATTGHGFEAFRIADRQARTAEITVHQLARSLEV